MNSGPLVSWATQRQSSCLILCDHMVIVYLSVQSITHCIMCTLSTSLSPGHDLPPPHLVCVRLQSPLPFPPCLSQHRHLPPSFPLSPLFLRYNKNTWKVQGGKCQPKTMTSRKPCESQRYTNSIWHLDRPVLYSFLFPPVKSDSCKKYILSSPLYHFSGAALSETPISVEEPTVRLLKYTWGRSVQD